MLSNRSSQVAVHGRRDAVDWSLFAPVRLAWRNRKLIWRLTRRDIEARYRGAWFGLLWSAIIPLMMALVYSFVFGHVFNSRWEGAEEAGVDFTLLLFSGVLVYSVFSETVNRSPGLMLENVSYIKKVVFPLEILPWVSLLSAIFNLAIGLIVLMAIYMSCVWAFRLPRYFLYRL
jgi:lipopolysaccharide transport system permease protein